MGEVVLLPVIRIERHNDGGKARIQRRRERLGLNEPYRGDDESLVMLRPDPEYIAPPSDCA